MSARTAMTIEDIIMDDFASGEFYLHQKGSLKLLKLSALEYNFHRLQGNLADTETPAVLLYHQRCLPVK